MLDLSFLLDKRGKMKNWGRKIALILISLILLLAILIIQNVSALGISPAMQNIVFQPGMLLDYSFKVIADGNKKIELYAAGEFSELVEFDKKEIIGGGVFNVKIKFPESIEKPGKHTILIGAREKIEEESGVGTSVAVQAPIVVFVPYPGKYAEISFGTSDVNVNEPINFQVGVSSLGNEAISASTSIGIYSDSELIETLDLGTKVIESQKSDVFKKSLTRFYKPGGYEAVASVDYEAGIAKANSRFRVGYLFVNVTNYTTEVRKKGIHPFTIGIESLWNNDLENVFAEVYVTRDNKSIADFVTPSTSIKKWEKKIIIGYLDTEKLETGRYDTKIKLYYENNLTIAEGRLQVTKESYLIYLIVIGAIVLIFAAIIYLRKYKTKDEEEKTNQKKRK